MIDAVAAVTRELVRQIEEAEKERDEAIAHARVLADRLTAHRFVRPTAYGQTVADDASAINAFREWDVKEQP